MTAFKVTEANSAQCLMVRHAAEVGWMPLEPQAAMRKLSDQAGMLPRGELEEALGRLNPWMANTAIRATRRALEAIPPAIEGNRADVTFLVNGVPVTIIEPKNPTAADAIDRGIEQGRQYEQETPKLLGSAQPFNVTLLLDYRYGVTWNASRRFMARWKERPEDSYRFAIQSFFEPTDFLRTLRDWILF